MSEMIKHMSYAKVYQFEHITFEYHRYCGPAFLRRERSRRKKRTIETCKRLCSAWKMVQTKQRSTKTIFNKLE